MCKKCLVYCLLHDITKTRKKHTTYKKSIPQAMYLTGLNQLLFCILNPSIILWTTTEFRTIGKRLLLEKVVTPIMNNLIGSIEDHSVNQSINETIPTVSRRVQISTLATQQIAGINLIADEDANILGRRRPHFIDHDKPLNVSQVL